MTGIKGIALQDTTTFNFLEKANASYKDSASGIKGAVSGLLIHRPSYALVGTVGLVQTLALGSLTTFLALLQASAFVLSAGFVRNLNGWKYTSKLRSECLDKTRGTFVESGIALTGILNPNWAVNSVKNAIENVKKAPATRQEEAGKALDAFLAADLKLIAEKAVAKEAVADSKEFETFVNNEYIAPAKKKIAVITAEFNAITKNEELYVKARSALNLISQAFAKANNKINKLKITAVEFNAYRYTYEYKKAQKDKANFGKLVDQKVADKMAVFKKAKEDAEKAGEKPEDKAATDRTAAEKAYQDLAIAFKKDLEDKLNGGLFKTLFLTKSVADDKGNVSVISQTYDEVIAAGHDPKKVYGDFLFLLENEVKKEFHARLNNDLVTPKPVVVTPAVTPAVILEEPAKPEEPKPEPAPAPQPAAEIGGGDSWFATSRRFGASLCERISKFSFRESISNMNFRVPGKN